MRKWAIILMGVALLGGCKPAAQPPQPPSPELQAAYNNRTEPLDRLLPKLVTLSLHDTPYAGRVQSSVLPVPGTSGDLWLRVHLDLAPGVDPKTSIRQQTLDLLGRLLVALNHKATHRIAYVISVRQSGGPDVPVEVDELVPSDVNTKDLKLGDIVPPERISPKLKVTEDHWDRLKEPLAGASR